MKSIYLEYAFDLIVLGLILYFATDKMWGVIASALVWLAVDVVWGRRFSALAIHTVVFMVVAVVWKP